MASLFYIWTMHNTKLFVLKLVRVVHVYNFKVDLPLTKLQFEIKMLFSNADIIVKN